MNKLGNQTSFIPWIMSYDHDYYVDYSYPIDLKPKWKLFGYGMKSYQEVLGQLHLPLKIQRI